MTTILPQNARKCSKSALLGPFPYKTLNLGPWSFLCTGTFKANLAVLGYPDLSLEASNRVETLQIGFNARYYPIAPVSVQYVDN